MANINKK